MKLYLSISMLLFVNFIFAQKVIYKDASQPIASRVSDLMSRMTLEEKIAQMCQYVGLDHMKEAEKKLTVEQMKQSDAQGFYVGLFTPDIIRMTTEGKIGSFLHVVTAAEANLLQGLAMKSKLQIPLLIGIDAIHGNGLVSGSSIYPSPISLAATWDDKLQYEIGRQTAIEMRATGSHWAFTPNIDVLRDPRWGRTGETYGEDPFMVGNMGVQTIKGMQGNDFTGNDKVIACAKHLIAGSQSVNGLNSAPTDVSFRTLMEIFLPPFKRAVQEGKLYSIMAAHNEVNGIPCHSDKFMMTDLLRNQWGFNGFYVSDWNDVSRIADLHHAAVDFKEASKLSVEAGLDMHMHGPLFGDYIFQLVTNKELALERVEQACSKILEAKFRLGLFENPMVDVKKIPTVLNNKTHQSTSLDASRKCITLMKNSGLLPLTNGGKKKIFLSGPNANNMTTLGDWVSPQPEENLITLYEGLQSLSEKNGYSVEYFDSGQRGKLMKDEDMEKAVTLAKNSDLIILALGENSFRHDWPNKTTGENIDRSSLQLSGKQLVFAQQMKKLGKPIIVVYISGSPIAETWIDENADAIINAWEPGNFGGQAIAEVIFGAINPSGKSPLTIPRSVGQLQMVYNYKPSTYKHKYHSEKKVPLYVFGHGLSYTTFEYANIKVVGDLKTETDMLTVTADVTNTGKVAGDEIAQLYIRDMVSQVTRPVMELKGYQRATLAPGEKKTVTFTLTPQALAYYNMAYDFVVEKGDFTIMIGGSSDSKKQITTNYTCSNNILINNY